jgi:phage FluMu protein Com
MRNAPTGAGPLAALAVVGATNLREHLGDMMHLTKDADGGDAGRKLAHCGMCDKDVKLGRATELCNIYKHLVSPDHVQHLKTKCPQFKDINEEEAARVYQGYRKASSQDAPGDDMAGSEGSH